VLGSPFLMRFSQWTSRYQISGATLPVKFKAPEAGIVLPGTTRALAPLLSISRRILTAWKKFLL
ncbi:hypothetical protein, partial [Roseibium sp.]|uniref:hypothetical protein n=1 Tax=Roseibium sp. TaxID=1936156 RepID=UPI003D09D32A